jgi:hypothetical protein
MQSMDGNNSLKRVEQAGHTDTRVFTSDRFIDPTEVERFRDNVQLQPGAYSTAKASSHGALPHDSDTTSCTNNWTAANTISDETIQMFEQTGVFISACCHGLVQTLVEMCHSGELCINHLHFILINLHL